MKRMERAALGLVGTQPREGARPWTRTPNYPTAVRLIFIGGEGSCGEGRWLTGQGKNVHTIRKAEGK